MNLIGKAYWQDRPWDEVGKATIWVLGRPIHATPDDLKQLRDCVDTLLTSRPIFDPKWIPKEPRRTDPPPLPLPEPTTYDIKES